MLSFTLMLSVTFEPVMLSVIMPNVVTPSFVAPRFKAQAPALTETVL
jgi:hypothetical protein